MLKVVDEGIADDLSDIGLMMMETLALNKHHPLLH